MSETQWRQESASWSRQVNSEQYVLLCIWGSLIESRHVFSYVVLNVRTFNTTLAGLSTRNRSSLRPPFFIEFFPISDFTWAKREGAQQAVSWGENYKVLGATKKNSLIDANRIDGVDRVKDTNSLPKKSFPQMCGQKKMVKCLRSLKPLKNPHQGTYGSYLDGSLEISWVRNIRYGWGIESVL